MIRMIAPIEFRMLFENGVITRLERLPNFVVARRDFSPGANVAASAVIRAPERNCLFNGAANALEIVRKIACVPICLCRHHSAPDSHAYICRSARILIAG